MTEKRMRRKREREKREEMGEWLVKTMMAWLVLIPEKRGRARVLVGWKRREREKKEERKGR